MKNTIVGLKELRNNMEEYISKIQQGMSFIIVRRSKPVFKISSPEEESEVWERVVNFTKINKKGVPIADVISRL